MYCMAVKAWGGELENHIPNAQPLGADEALVRVTACGLCHSDLHIQDGYFDLGAGAKLDLPAALLPLVMGHEPEGVVEALGAGAALANPDVKVGDRVAVYPWIGCGGCAACLRGAQHICGGVHRGLGTRLPGGFATHLRVPDASALIPAEGLAPGVAGAAMCSGLTAYAALNQVLTRARGAPLALVGLGGVGLMALAIAKALHDGPIIAIDIDSAKREAARARGADLSINPEEDNALAAFLTSTGGAAAVVDFVGNPASFSASTQIVRRGGAIVVVGLYGGATPLAIATLPLRALSLIGSYVGSLLEARELIALLRAGAVAPAPITLRPLREINAAIHDLRAGLVIGRVALTP
jgi:D-arabinose 1-dehydrogenase-like Zn-dependent alcohol dehydrogenase